ncbi:MAG: pitrilysin family protein [bacterium]
MKTLFAALTLLLVGAAASALPLYRDSLPNGLVVLTYEDSRLAMTDVALVCRNGHDADPLDRAGLAILTTMMLGRGTRSMSADSFAAVVEFLGARIDGIASEDHSRISGRFLSRDLATGLDLLADAVLNPAFDSLEVELARRQALTGARRRTDYPSWQVTYELDRLLFPGHPFSTMLSGDTVSVAAIRRAELVEFHRRHYVPNNCFVVIVGDVNRPAVLADVERRFGAWARADVPAPVLPEPPMPEGITGRVITRPEMNQTYIAFGHPGIRMSDTDLLAARLGSYILGGSALSSRLGVAVREEAGLAYDVRCWFDRLRPRGGFYATVQTSRPADALRLMFAEIARMHDSGPTDEEVRKAHGFYTGSFPLGYSSNSGKVREVITQELYGLGMDWLETFPDRVRAVDRAAIGKAMAGRLNPGNYYLVVIGNVTRDELGLSGVNWLD